MNIKMRQLKRTRYSRRGTVLILAAMFLLLIVGITAVAVDGGLLYMTRNECQTTADAAALAAVSHLPNSSDAQTAALDYAEKNMPSASNGNGSVLLSSDAVPGHWDGATRMFMPNGAPLDAVKVTIRRSQQNNNPMPMMFAGSVFGPGYEKADVLASAVATSTAKKGTDIMIVQDVTGSFSTDIVFARKADVSLLDCIKNKTDGTSLIGLTTFTGCGKLNQAMLPVAASYATLRASLLTINTCGNLGMPVCSGTNIAQGLKIGMTELVSKPLSPNARNQAIVLVTDGMPNHNGGSVPPASCGPNTSDAQLSALALQQADLCWANGISVFCIWYNDDNVPGSAGYLASLVRGEGIFLSTPIAADLPSLLLQICDALGGPPRLVD